MERSRWDRFCLGIPRICPHDYCGGMATGISVEMMSNSTLPLGFFHFLIITELPNNLEKIFGCVKTMTESQCVAELFKLYQKLTK